MVLTAGQRSDYIGARALLQDLPAAKHLLADRGYDADWYRKALQDKGIQDKGIAPCIPSRKGRKAPITHDEDRYKNRYRIENSFARLKDWRGGQHATTDARRLSSPHAHWLRSSCSGYES